MGQSQGQIFDSDAGHGRTSQINSGHHPPYFTFFQWNLIILTEEILYCLYIGVNVKLISEASS
jgi:hypothetical protein